MFKKTARRSTGSDPTLPAPVTSRLGTDASEPVSPRDHVEYESSSIPVISVEERNRHDDKVGTDESRSVCVICHGPLNLIVSSQLALARLEAWH